MIVSVNKDLSEQSANKFLGIIATNTSVLYPFMCHKDRCANKLSLRYTCMYTSPLVFVTEGLSVTICGIYCLITWRSSTCLLIRIVYKSESLLLHRTQIEKQKRTDKLQNRKESVSVVYLYNIHCKN